MAALPDISRWPVAFDVESSGLFTDDGARISVVSYAYRDPDDGTIVSRALPFDQGITDLPLGDKDLPSNHAKRLAKTKLIEVPYLDPASGERRMIEVVPAEEFADPAPNLDPRWFTELMGWLAEQRLIVQNYKYDALQARAGLRGRPPVTTDPAAVRGRLVLPDGGGADLSAAFWWDTQLGQAVLDPQHSTSLKPTAVRLHLGAEIGFDSGSEDAEQRALAPWLGPRTGKNADPRFDLVPWWVMEPYAELDAILHLLLYEHQVRRLEVACNWADGAPLWGELSRQFDLMQVLYRMECRGIRFDGDGCLDQADKLEALKAEAASELEFDPTPDKARAYFFGPESAGGLACLPREDKITAGGAPQVDEEAIEALTRHPSSKVATAAKAYQRHENLKSAIVKWYGNWPYRVGEDDRLRTSYRQAHVVSGRLSVERVQLQAIPRDYQLPQGIESIRRFFEPDPDGTLWEIDLSQAEPRIATVIARCEPAYQALVTGQDYHSTTTRLVFSPTFGDEFGPDHPDWDEYRQVGKRLGLAILYAAGPRTIRAQIRLFTGIDYPESQVKEWVNLTRKAYGAFVKANEDSSQFADKYGYIRTITGRRSYFKPHEPLHGAFNRKIQGSVADGMTQAMIEIEAAHPGLMLLQVHDSLVLQTRRGVEGIEQVAQVAAVLRESFESMFRIRWYKNERRHRHLDFPVEAKLFGAQSYLDGAKEANGRCQAAIDEAWAAHPAARS